MYSDQRNAYIRCRRSPNFSSEKPSRPSRGAYRHRYIHMYILFEIRGETDASRGTQSATREVAKQPSGTTPQTDIGAGPHQRRRSIGCQRRGRKNSIAENYPEINVGISFVEGHSRESPSRNELGKTSR